MKSYYECVVTKYDETQIIYAVKTGAFIVCLVCFNKSVLCTEKYCTEEDYKKLNWFNL